MSAEFENQVMKQVRKRRKEDMREAIRAVLACPSRDDGDIMDVDSSRPLSYYLDKNVDVMTRIAIVNAISAGNGDIKSAEFLMKYGDYTPAQEATLSVVPMIVDDIPLPTAEKRPLPAPEPEEPVQVIDVTPEKCR